MGSLVFFELTCRHDGYHSNNQTIFTNHPQQHSLLSAFDPALRFESVVLRIKDAKWMLQSEKHFIGRNATLDHSIQSVLRKFNLHSLIVFPSTNLQRMPNPQLLAPMDPGSSPG
jgi:hypothetical protein